MEFDENAIHCEIYIHVAWSTKNQQPVLTPFAQYLYEHICDLALSCDCNVIEGYVFSDHVQLIMNFSPNISFTDLITALKVSTGMLIRTNIPELKDFEWQKSDFSFTASKELISSTINKNAKPFPEEVHALLSNNGISDYDVKEALE